MNIDVLRTTVLPLPNLPLLSSRLIWLTTCLVFYKQFFCSFSLFLLSISFIIYFYLSYCLFLLLCCLFLFLASIRSKISVLIDPHPLHHTQHTIGYLSIYLIISQVHTITYSLPLKHTAKSIYDSSVTRFWNKKWFNFLQSCPKKQPLKFYSN